MHKRGAVGDDTTVNPGARVAGRMADLVGAFESSLSALDVPLTRTTAAGVPDALDEAIVEPAVGVPLGIEGVSLPPTVTIDPSPAQLGAARTGVTPAGLGIAEYGTVVVRVREAGDDPVSLYPERHVAVVRESDVVPDMPAAIAWLADEFDAGRRSAILATGASATADMGALVEGVHGPSDVHVIAVTDR